MKTKSLLPSAVALLALAALLAGCSGTPEPSATTPTPDTTRSKGGGPPTTP